MLFLKSIWSMGLFQAVKKLYHFEIPIGYCYSPLDGNIMYSCCDGSRYMVSEGSECEKFKIVLESMEWLNSFSDSL